MLTLTYHTDHKTTIAAWSSTCTIDVWQVHSIMQGPLRSIALSLLDAKILCFRERFVSQIQELKDRIRVHPCILFTLRRASVQT